MLDKIEVGKIYKSSINHVVFVVRYDKTNNEYLYYFLDSPDILLRRYKDDALHWWSHM